MKTVPTLLSQLCQVPADASPEYVEEMLHVAVATIAGMAYEMGGGDLSRIRQLVPDNVAQGLAEKLSGRPAERHLFP